MSKKLNFKQIYRTMDEMNALAEQINEKAESLQHIMPVVDEMAANMEFWEVSDVNLLDVDPEGTGDIHPDDDENINIRDTIENYLGELWMDEYTTYTLPRLKELLKKYVEPLN